jgi:hypothetical protein
MGQFSRQSKQHGKPQIATPVGLGVIRKDVACGVRKPRESGNVACLTEGGFGSHATKV